MLLSHGSMEKKPVPSSPAAERMFVCRTCNRRFLSFQALGGHRASHKKLRAGAVGETEMGNPKVHQCSVCGLEFAVGQALGGHMRRHRMSAATAAEQEEGEKVGGEEGRRVMWMDLNLTPTENDLVIRKMGEIGIGVGDSIAVENCFH